MSPLLLSVWLSVAFVALNTSLYSAPPVPLSLSGSGGVLSSPLRRQLQGFICNAWPPSGVQTMLTANDRPAMDDLNDGQRIVLGQRFLTVVPGTIRAVRFFKTWDEGGEGHSGRIYDASSGALLARTGSFNDDSCAGPGWVAAPLLQPFRTTANTHVRELKQAKCP